MATVTINDTHLTDIGNSIRSKNGSTTKYKPSEMATAISAITTKEDLDTELTQQNTLLSTQTVTVNDIKTALEGKGSAAPTKAMRISENGTYDVTNYATAIVDVDFSEREDKLINGYISGEYVNNSLFIVEKYAFASFDNLESLTLGSAKTFNTYAIIECPRLVTLNLPKASSFSSYSLSQLTSLETLYVPELKYVGAHSFNELGITTLNLPKVETLKSSYTIRTLENCTRIDFGALSTISASNTIYNCEALREIIIRTPSVCTLSNPNLYGVCGTPNIYVPDNLVDSYKTSENWTRYAAQIKPLSELEG
jgi:hypothetical protein